jgi:hypothetical protein
MRREDVAGHMMRTADKEREEKEWLAMASSHSPHLDEDAWLEALMM